VPIEPTPCIEWAEVRNTHHALIQETFMKARFLSPICAATLTLVVFATSPAASARETRIHTFTPGANPVGLVADRAGNLYGTTGSDGFYKSGTAYQVRLSGGLWTESDIYSFTGGSDGANPESALTSDAQGNLYGTAQYGGSGTCRCGTVFELSPSKGGVWKETTLYAFAGGADGSYPRYANLIIDPAGNIYGVTEFGGSSLAGTVFELSPQAGGGWTESVLYTFAGGTSDGANPFGGLVFDKAGNLYGSTYSGGSQHCGGGGCGGVFELSPQAGGGWQEQMLYLFQNGGDGSTPDSLLIIDPAGNLYGTTQFGGSVSCGTVFELSPGTGGEWTEKTLHAFTGPDGCAPTMNLLRDGAGNLYGITADGGPNDDGVVFEITSAGTEQALFDFQGGNGGAFPASLIVGPTGRALFGVTSGFGSTFSGVIFEISK
jgi:uncharacterized repeat protein (TIGR03803 family)